METEYVDSARQIKILGWRRSFGPDRLRGRRKSRLDNDACCCHAPNNPNPNTRGLCPDDWAIPRQFLWALRHRGGNADYIDWAFEAARAADPDCKLFINDYNTELAGKRGRFVGVIADLLARNIPLDGAGHQMHLNVDTPVSEALAAIDAVDELFLGLDQHITELDISIYSDPGSCFASQTNCDADYGGAIPDSIMTRQAELYRDLFNGFAERVSVTSVTTWGVSDAASWLDNYPVTRTNAPLLWDRDREAKSALQAILDPDFAP